MDYVHALAVGGYLFRLAGTRSRSLSLYAGGGVLTGLEALDPFTSLPGNIVLGRTKYSFLYGVYAQGAMEWFVGRKLAVVLQASTPVTIGSAIGWMHWSIGLGLKLNL